jgi:hypothetical protein
MNVRFLTAKIWSISILLMTKLSRCFAEGIFIAFEPTPLLMLTTGFAIQSEPWREADFE